MGRRLFSLKRRAPRFLQIAGLILALVAIGSHAVSAASSSLPRPTLILQFGNPFQANVWSFAVRAPLMAVGVPAGIQLWDTRTWELRRTILVSRDDPSQDPSALGMALSPDGKLLAAVTTNGSIAFWESASGIQRRIIRHAPTEHLLFTADGKEIVGSGPGRLRDRPHGSTTFWNVQTGKIRLRLPIGGDFALSADSRRVAVVGYANTMSAFKVTLWDAHTGKPSGTLADGRGVLGPLDFSPNGKQIVTVGEDPQWVPPSGGPFSQSAYAHNLTLKIWDVDTQKLLHTMPGWSNQSGQRLQWSSDGNHIVSLAGDILVYNPAGNQEHLITGQNWAALASANGETVIANEKSGVTSLELRTGIRHTYQHDFLEATYVNSAAYSPEGSLLAIGEGNAARLWDQDLGTTSRVLPYANLNHLFFLPSSQSLATAGSQRIQIWDAGTGETKHIFTNGLPETVDTMSPDYIKIMQGIDLLLSPDGKTLLRKSGDHSVLTADVLDAATGQTRVTLQGMDEPLDAGVVSSNGIMLANKSDGTGQSSYAPSVKVWNLHDGRSMYQFHFTSSYPGPYAFSSDSKTLAVGDSRGQGDDSQKASVHSRITLYNLRNGRPRLTIDIGTNPIRSLLFSPNRPLLAVSQSSQIKFYETTTGKLIGALTLPQENLLTLAFSPDGTRLVTEGFAGPSGNLMRLWRVRDGHLLATLVGLTVNDHTTPEWLAFTPEGYYASSPGARKAIRFRVGNHLMPADRCPEMDRPDLIRKAMQDK